MLSRKKCKSPCPFASSKKASKRKELSNSFGKNRADVLAASSRGSHVGQEKLIALDEKQSRWENETVSYVLAGRKLKAKAKTNLQNRTHKSHCNTWPVKQFLPNPYWPCCTSGGIQILQRIFSARSNIWARFVHAIGMRSIAKVT